MIWDPSFRFSLLPFTMWSIDSSVQAVSAAIRARLMLASRARFFNFELTSFLSKICKQPMHHSVFAAIICLLALQTLLKQYSQKRKTSSLITFYNNFVFSKEQLSCSPKECHLNMRTRSSAEV